MSGRWVTVDIAALWEETGAGSQVSGIQVGVGFWFPMRGGAGGGRARRQQGAGCGVNAKLKFPKLNGINDNFWVGLTLFLSDSNSRRATEPAPMFLVLPKTILVTVLDLGF